MRECDYYQYAMVKVTSIPITMLSSTTTAVAPSENHKLNLKDYNCNNNKYQGEIGLSLNTSKSSSINNSNMPVLSQLKQPYLKSNRRIQRLDLQNIVDEVLVLKIILWQQRCHMRGPDWPIRISWWCTYEYSTLNGQGLVSQETHDGGEMITGCGLKLTNVGCIL